MNGENHNELATILMQALMEDKNKPSSPLVVQECKNCGNEISMAARWCPVCGRKPSGVQYVMGSKKQAK